MKAKQITYSRLISKGNYENEKIEICLEVEDGEKAMDVFREAKKFVDGIANKGKVSDWSLENAYKVINDKDNHTGNQIKDAESLINKHKQPELDELPF